MAAGNPNEEMKDLLYIRKIIAPQKKDSSTGELINVPDGYDGVVFKTDSLWFIETADDEE